ncbi:hypothetical protein EJB05_34221, partial [Eragrostis curvula]
MTTGVVHPVRRHSDFRNVGELFADGEWWRWKTVWFREGRERDNNKTHIIPCHILLAIRNDKELSLLAGVTIPHAGVLPNIHLELLPKKATCKDDDCKVRLRPLPLQRATPVQL